MSEALDRLAATLGVELSYHALTGERIAVSDEAKRGVLAAMGIAAGDDDAIAASLATVHPLPLGDMSAPPGVSCYMPHWLMQGRAWGIGCQLYALRSERNWGIGDFEDLADIAEVAARAGADFVGVNPLHALFLADPERCSPFSPSSRLFLNPLYIAIDRAPGFGGMEDALVPPEALQAGDLVDYTAVARAKLRALEILFRIFETRGADDERDDFARFVAAGGQPLYLHALFETLSFAMSDAGNGATWHGWPGEFQHPGTDSVRAFAEEQRERVSFHAWLQWVADRQLADAKRRAETAGLRIGLYLDYAVGVAPDGSATWSDRALVAPAARIGAPPDYFNAAGQDWGLAPLSPAGLAARDFEPFAEAIDTVLRHAGAIRIDHAMSLYRLFWIASGLTAADGVYVRYPFHAMLEALGRVSRARNSIVIGEDLGIVPPGFREVMQATEIQSYRVFFFEKRDDWFIPPHAYPREALACLTTHDLYTLAGWWIGHNIDVRCSIGMLSEAERDQHLVDLSHERRRVLGLLAENDLLPHDVAPVMRGEAEPSAAIPESMAVAMHRLMARTPSRLIVAQAEDLTGSIDQVNIPGTTGEHPNWRRRLTVHIADLPAHPFFHAITVALREERPKRD